VWFRKRADALPPEGYPARLAVCPRGHVRSIPTRFDTPVSTLRCTVCNRSYDISAT
jgi:hypothetical protein